MSTLNETHKKSHQAKFLACFGACGSIIQASRWAKIDRHCHYDWMWNDPEYPAQFAKAEKKAARTLEDEAVRRAHEGVRQAIYHRGRIVGWKREYSDTLMQTLLKANNPDKFRDRSTVDQVVSGGLVPITLQVVGVAPLEKPIESDAGE